MLTFGSLFAGIGGFDLGLERAGMHCLWQVEIDDFCQKVLAKHWPNVTRYRDVRECGKHNLEPVDLICGGFPCQPHSTAGKRRGAQDDRDLWSEYRRVISELRPRWVIGENVLGIRTTILDAVLSDLESLAYSVETLVIPACAFNAPHRRERIFIVGWHSNSMRCNWNNRAKQEISNQDSNADRVCKNVAHATGARFQTEWSMSTQQSGHVNQPPAEYGGNHWAIEPDVGRVADGVPNRVDRLRTLGNAVVPQVAEWVGRQIMKVEQGYND